MLKKRSIARNYLSYTLRDCYNAMKKFTAEVCISEMWGRCYGLINMALYSGIITSKEAHSYLKVFFRLYSYKRGWSICVV